MTNNQQPTTKKGYCIIIIGGRGQGKTTFIKKMIQGKPNYIFDVQNEYSEGFNPCGHTDRNLFLHEASQFIQTQIVIEEATGFFKGHTNKILDQMMLSVRHTNNNIYFVFHNIQAVPPAIVNMCNYVVLFKTADMQPNVIKNKYPLIYRYHVNIKNKPDHYKFIIDTGI
jgi:GTPase SAR1 family protein